jgi:hypothetical protein
MIDGSIDGGLENSIDSKVRSTMLYMNDETTKNKLNLLNLVLHQLSVTP